MRREVIMGADPPRPWPRFTGATHYVVEFESSAITAMLLQTSPPRVLGTYADKSEQLSRRWARQRKS